MRIPGLHDTSPVELLKRSVKDFLKDDMPTYAAALAYSALFALFPFLLFLIALTGCLSKGRPPCRPTPTGCWRM
jgi:uncharacterized BrkB/YihY/UPF0761 family membrane protein